MLFYGKEQELTTILQSLSGTNSAQVDPATYAQFLNGRIDAADNVSITNKFTYADESVIGYRYTIEIAGVLTKFNPIQPNPPVIPNPNATAANNAYGHNLTSKLRRMDVLRKLVNFQGGSLFYTNEIHEILFCARGCILKSLTFDEGTWTDRVPYSLTFECQEIDFLGTQKNVEEGILDATSSFSANLLDPRKYKIKEFTDEISYNFEDMHSDINYVDPDNGAFVGVQNSFYRITYSISATGENWYTTGNKIIPAWEQAKMFCQDRLYKKIVGMVNSANARILGIDDSSADVGSCFADYGLPYLYSIPPSLNMVFDGDNNEWAFKVYNENISATTSESDGTFSVSYNAIVKRGNRPFIHKYSKSINYSSSDAAKTYNLKGTVQGLTPGGLFVGDLGSVQIPPNGFFMIGRTTEDSTVNKRFDRAQTYFSSITVGGETDISDAIKSGLGVTHQNLLLEGFDSAVVCQTLSHDYPRAASFNVVKNWHEGTIEWEAEYNSNLDCAGKHSSVDIQINRGVPVTATISIPNGSVVTPLNPKGIGQYIVYIGAYTNSTMDVTIKGFDVKYCCLGRPPDAATDLGNFIAASNTPITLYPEIASRLPDSTTSILTKSQKSLNIYTGEYTIQLSYIICNPGCLITQGL